MSSHEKSQADPKDVAAYESVRATEGEVYELAGELQLGGTATRGAANAVDKLGQDLSGIRGELEDKIFEQDPTYFRPQ